MKCKFCDTYCDESTRTSGRRRQFCSDRCRKRYKRHGYKIEASHAALQAVMLAAGVMPDFAPHLYYAAEIVRGGIRRLRGL